MGRMVYALPGHFVVIKNPKIFKYLRTSELLLKYLPDRDRMVKSFLDSVELAKKDPQSRQLMVFNDHEYQTIHQCFTHMQFVMTKRKEFDLYVYQRSADLVKLKDDLTFFAHTAEEFQDKVGKKVTKIVVVYGNIHYTKE